MGTGWKKFDPSSFFQFFLEHPQKNLEENKVFLKASICDVLMVESLLEVDPTQSYGENTKSPIQDFIDFAMKTHWKLIFFSQIHHKYLLFFHIIVWFSHIFMILNWNSKNKCRKKLQFLIGFYSRIYEILDGAFCIFPITLGRVDPQQWFGHQNITSWSLSEYLIIFPKKIWRVPGKIGKNQGGHIFLLVPMLKNFKKNFFVFHDVAISSFVQYQFQITKM